MPHDPRSPFIFVDGVGHTASGDQVMSNFDSVWAGLDSAIAGVAASIDAPVQTPVLTARQVRDVGEANQVRAGRVLTAADFTRIGLSAPAGLWNLGDLTDVSGNGRTLTNKGTVTFTSGILGAATEAAQFTGSTAQALYIADTGAADPFRIKTGSWGCWFRTAKRGTSQYMGGKYTGTAAVSSYSMGISTGNVINADVTAGGSIITAVGTADVCDDRWHHLIVTYDATRVRVYVDGALDGSLASGVGTLNTAASAPLDIGGLAADGATAALLPFYGRVDEAFVTADVLTPEQVLNLYCARITQPLGVAPTGTVLNVYRRRRGGVLATGDFPTSPTRLHNFTGGALTDQGTGGVALTQNPSATNAIPVGGADGMKDGAYSLSGGYRLNSTDAGLPSGTAARSYGCWLKTTTGGTLLSWGSTPGSLDVRLWTSGGNIVASSGADNATATGIPILDGLWHHVVATEDNAAGDGVKRKLYVDGRLAAGSTVLNGITLAGANRFNVGANTDGTGAWVGQIDGAFVYSGALTAEQVRALWNVGSQALAASPKAEGDHVEALQSADVLAHFDTLEGCDLVDLSVVG
jgi:hypothetical protein